MNLLHIQLYHIKLSNQLSNQLSNILPIKYYTPLS